MALLLLLVPIVAAFLAAQMSYSNIAALDLYIRDMYTCDEKDKSPIDCEDEELTRYAALLESEGYNMQKFKLIRGENGEFVLTRK